MSIGCNEAGDSPVRPCSLAQSAMACSSAIWRASRVVGAGLGADWALTLTAPAPTMLAMATATAAIPTAGRTDLGALVFVMLAADREGLNGRSSPHLTCGFRSLSSL